MTRTGETLDAPMCYVWSGASVVAEYIAEVHNEDLAVMAYLV